MLEVGCPRCPGPVERSGSQWRCGTHGSIDPLRRPREVTYAEFAEHLGASAPFPTYLPWPLGPGWRVTDFATCGTEPEHTRATVTCASGVTDPDGPVEVLVVSEEPGTGLGARVAGLRHADPGPEVRRGIPAVRVRVDGQVVPLWTVSTSAGEREWDRSALVGEAEGRWLWLVLRPAPAVLLLRDTWILRDVARAGPHLVELPFGGAVRPW